MSVPSVRRRGQSSRSRRPNGLSNTTVTWIQSKWPILRFVGLFGFFMSLAYVCEITPSIRQKVFPAYLRHNARVSGAILRVMGEDANVRDRSISSPRFALEVQHGCNALLPTALFVSGVLACPVSFSAKIPGILVGAAVLMFMNLVRIVTMFYTGIHIRSLFDIMHTQVWPSLFVSISVLLWICWAVWARNRSSSYVQDSG